MGPRQCGLLGNFLQESFEVMITFRPPKNENGIASLLSNFRVVPFEFMLCGLLHPAP